MSPNDRPDTHFGMTTPRHSPDVVPGVENAAGQSTAADLDRSRTLYPGRLSPEQRDLREQARAERRAGKVLDRLVRVGIRTLHDRRLPRAAGQLDHVVVTGSGLYVVTDVAATRRRPLEWSNGIAYVGRQPLTAAAQYTVAAAQDIANTVATDLDPGWTVVSYAFLVIVGDQVPAWVQDGAEVMGIHQLADAIRYRPPVLDQVEVALLADAAARVCPPAG